MGFEQQLWTEHKRMVLMSKGKESLNSATVDKMVLKTYWCPHFLNFKFSHMSQCVWGKFMGTMGQLIWCWVTGSVSLVTIFVELLCSIRPFFRQAGLLTATQMVTCVLSLTHFLRKLPVPDTSSCLTSFPFIHIKPIPQAQLSYLLQKRLFYLTIGKRRET